jgi:hypothetical protein
LHPCQPYSIIINSLSGEAAGGLILQERGIVGGVALYDE